MNNKKTTDYFDLPSEQSLLGLLLAGGENSLKKTMFVMQAEHFYDPKHKVIFEAINKIYSERKYTKVDVNIISTLLTKEGNINKAGGVDYLESLLLLAGSDTYIDFYTHSIIDCFDRNKLRQSTLDSLKQLDNPENKLEQVLGDIHYKITNFNSLSTSKEFIGGNEGVKKSLDLLTSIREDDTKKIFSKFEDMDNILHGFHRGDLVILAARPSVGKTAFAINLLQNFAEQNKKVAFFSLEMPQEQIYFRMLSRLTNIEGDKFKNPKTIYKNENTRLVQKMEDKLWSNIYMDDSAGLGINDLIWKARKLHSKVPLDAIIIDYLQFIRYDGNKRLNDRHLEVSIISNSLKNLARELNVPVISLAQLSRKIEQREDKTPMLSDLRESGSIEQDADVIIFMSRESYQKYDSPNLQPQDEEISQQSNDFKVTDFHIAKHRNGNIGLVKLMFEPKFSRFFTLRDPNMKQEGPE